MHQQRGRHVVTKTLKTLTFFNHNWSCRSRFKTICIINEAISIAWRFFIFFIQINNELYPPLAFLLKPHKMNNSTIQIILKKKPFYCNHINIFFADNKLTILCCSCKWPLPNLWNPSLIRPLSGWISNPNKPNRDPRTTILKNHH